MDLTESELILKQDMERQLGFIVNNPNILDSNGNTPLMLVNMFYNDPINLLYDNPVNYTKLLIKMGADPNIVHHEYGTALHFAVHNNNVETLKYLLSVGANPFFKDVLGETPYDLAVYWNTEMANILKDHMIRKIQNKQLRRMTRRRARTMKRLATAKSMLTENNPISHMDHDTMSYLMSNYLM